MSDRAPFSRSRLLISASTRCIRNGDNCLLPQSRLSIVAESKAREMGLSELLTLSTQAFTYFQSKGGFTEGTPDDLPPGRREKYDQSGRNSKVLVKKLAKAG